MTIRKIPRHGRSSESVIVFEREHMISNLATRFILTAAVLLWTSGAAWAADVLVAGQVAIVSSGKLIKFVAKSKQQPQETAFPIPAPGSGEDPTVAGATIELFDTATPGAGFISFNLDAAGWSGLGNPAGSGGYRYMGKDDVSDRTHPCRTVVLQDALITMTCKGTAVTLAPPFAGDLQVVLRVPGGSSTLRYCATFGGDTRRNDTTSFKRKDAPAPAGCPFVEPTPTPTATPTSTPSCTDGFALGGACWFTGSELGQSCDQVCAGEGLVYDEATRTVAGSDGTDANCQALLDGFAFPSPWAGSADCDVYGVGCSSMPIEFVSGRCATPPTTADASHPSVVRFCACL